MRISEIPHVDHGRIAVCPCQATFRIDDATVVEEFSLPDLPPPESIGQYRILRYVGRGASNCVYEGTDPDTGDHVAIKTLLPEYAGDKPSREQFLHAAKIYAKAIHPNIVKVFETGKNADGVPFIAMEFLSGGTLADRLTGNKHFSAREAAEIAVAVCSALAVTSKLGIVHRDIKPDNIMVSADGKYKVTDLGLAKFDASSGTGSAALVLDEAAQSKPPVKTSFGTLEYMSPEQYIDAETCDVRSDIYSLGVTLYYLVAGRLPFEPQTRSELRHMHLSVEPVVPSTFVPEIPIDFDYIVLHCIQKNPDDRYRTPDELLADLEAFLAGKPLPSTTSGAVPIFQGQDSRRSRTTKTGRAWVLPAIATLLVLLIFCTVGLLLLTNRKRQPAEPQSGENGLEVADQGAVPGKAGSGDSIFEGETEPLPVRISSNALKNGGDVDIVDQETDEQTAVYFEEAKEKAEKALEEGSGYQDAIDYLENFVSLKDYSTETLALIFRINKALAVHALEEGSGYQDAIDALGKFIALEAYSTEALDLCFKLKKAMDAAEKSAVEEAPAEEPPETEVPETEEAKTEEPAEPALIVEIGGSSTQ